MIARLRLQPADVGMGLTGQRVRDRLIEDLRAGGIADERVLNAIRTVPRHQFVDEALASRAYENNALPIGHGQTISQPYVVAKMTAALLRDGSPRRVLEVGTGSGYQAAVLAALGMDVFTVERIGDLLRTARKRFRALGLHVRSKHDDGRLGWSEQAPFDAIIVTAAGPALVDALLEQLAPGGVLVAPVGATGAQTLLRLRKQAEGGITREDLGAVVFVPLLSGMID
ncbi:MAG: protein-L-isoaspartate(D-aspartate) O-methyltransferase [Xanthomonadales bacterium]|nr:protein-L-isoaspartate(D-aspartate) O-methyltransferase [Xanthomonadales bacterium]MBN8794592.1 protein-L-isoaspartate(D-aspartate) O-methyltransferase [Stenotrophomonas nitritireducens]